MVYNILCCIVLLILLAIIYYFILTLNKNNRLFNNTLFNNTFNQVSSYDDVNTFKLSNNKYLFFDIFCKNNIVYLICPVYMSSDKFDDINISCNNSKLYQHNIFLKIEGEPCVVIEYQLNNRNKYNNIIVEYNNIINNYYLENYITNEKFLLTTTTLMKDDYKLINVYYDYYIKQGVEFFYIYYNGIITQDIINMYNKEKIKLIEWNYHYWNKDCDFVHHAQMGQIHHALYKYGKNMSEYMIFNDMDEYMHIQNDSIINYIRNNLNVDTFMFLNNWCKTIDGTIPEKLPNKIMKSTKIYNINDRSKCIHKIDSVKTLGIHSGANYTFSNPIITTDNLLLLHFYYFTQNNRTINENYIEYKLN